jgi:hypothetical protein
MMAYPPALQAEVRGLKGKEREGKGSEKQKRELNASY